MAQPKNADQPFRVNLGGKLITATDPLISSPGDFQSLINMRYSDRLPYEVLGMTKINTSAFDYPQIQNGFYFRKDSTNEQHVFVDVASGSNSKIKKSNNTTSVPEQDTFADFLTLSDNLAYFSPAPDESMMIMDGNANYIWSGDEFRCASFIVTDDNAQTFSYDYTSAITNTINDAQDRAIMYVDSNGNCTVIIGSIRPISGAKFYIGTANTNVATASVKYWNGAWTSCTNVVDNTVLVAGKTLSQAGFIAFDSTATTVKVSVENGDVLYYYKFLFTGLNPATTVYYCTLKVPVQSIKDIWDGNPRTIAEAWYHDGNGHWNNYSTALLKQDYVDGNTLTYGELGTANNNCGELYLGFTEPQMAAYFYLPDPTKVNSSSDSVLTVFYWNGTAWTSVGSIVDGTVVAGQIKTMGRVGTVSWTSPDYNSEFKTSVQDSNQYYYYKFVFSYTSGSTFGARIDLVTGIPVPTKIVPYRFSVLWNNSLWLVNDQVQYKNSAFGFAPGTSSIANGTQSITLTLGDDEELVAGGTLFSRFGNSIYDDMILFKRNATYLIDGTKPDNYVTYCISNRIGCVAPLTVQTCDTSYEVAPGLSKHIIIWQSDRGIEYFDGNTVSLISNDIEDFFDSARPNYINVSLVETFSSFYDEEKLEYHWLCVTGENTQREMVYNLTFKKWFEIQRGTGKYLSCGFSVSDPSGNKYVFGGTSDGYLERLENGTDFDGNPIVFDMWTVDQPLNPKYGIEYIAKLRHFKIMCVAKNSETIPVTASIYRNSELLPQESWIFSSKDALKRVLRELKSPNIDGYCFSFRLQGQSSTTEIGFEPLTIAGVQDLLREDIY